MAQWMNTLIAVAALGLALGTWTGCESSDDTAVDGGAGGGASGGGSGQGSLGGSNAFPTGGSTGGSAAGGSATGGGSDPAAGGGTDPGVGGSGGEPDPGVGGQGDGGTGGVAVGGAGGDEPVGGAGGGEPPMNCDDIPIPPNLDTECTQETAQECVPGICLRDAADSPAGICRQVCFPGLCEDVCRDGELCMPLANPETGEPATREDGTPVGACIRPPEGDVPPYGLCDQNNACQAGSVCAVVSAEATAGFCAPECGENNSCPSSAEGGTPVCGVGSDPNMPTHCAVMCQDIVNHTECAENLRCVNMGGANICQP